MKTLQGNDGKIDAICGALYRFYQRPWVQYLGAPAVVAAPPWAIVKALDSATAKNFLRSISPDFAAFIERYDIAFFLLAGIYSWIAIAIAKMIAKRVESRSVDTRSLLSLLATIDHVVGCKLERFMEHVRIGCKDITSRTAFATITKPEAQIAELMLAVSNYFNAVMEAKSRRLIRVVLASIENGKITKIPIYLPKDEPIQSSLDDLNAPNSAFSNAVRTRKIVVIENIGKELRRGTAARYVSTVGEGNDHGSIICFPVVGAPKKVVFVISVHCEEDGYFKKDLAPQYELTLSRFALRLNLENSLLQMKEALCGPAN